MWAGLKHWHQLADYNQAIDVRSQCHAALVPSLSPSHASMASSLTLCFFDLAYRKRFIFMSANLHRVSNGNSVAFWASVSVSPARLVDELLQPCFDLIIGEESHVPRVSNSQAVPISQQGGPRLHTHTHTKIKVNSMKGICPHTVYKLKTKSNL